MEEERVHLQSMQMHPLFLTRKIRTTVLHIRRKRSRKKQRYLRDRMGKCKFARMQCYAVDAGIIRIVQIIPKKRMAQILHMHTNLMGSAGFQLKFHERTILAGF